MKILIIGASGSGTTTLGKELSRVIDYTHLDVDDYYWQQTDPPFLCKEDKNMRQRRLQTDFESYKNVIVSGSLVSWGDFWKTAFDLVVFVRLDKEIRMQRLQERELERYGDRLKTDEKIVANSQAFLDWAAKYDDPTFKGRSIKVHLDWLETVSSKVIEITSKTSVETNVSVIKNMI